MPETEHSLQLPLLDISQPVLPSTLSSIFQACKDWGFFYITNHGISKDLSQKFHILSRQVFNLPLDTKLQLGPASPINTYTPKFIASPFFESIRVCGPDYHASAKNSSAILFGTPDAKFCEMVQEYGSKMMELSKKIVVVLLKCLGDGLVLKHLDEFSRCHGYLRINNYTPPENIKAENVEGLGMHTDMSCITILHQDANGGLQMRSKEGDWVDLLPNEDALAVNIGDLLQAWSNGRLRSSKHRVILKQPVNRFSVAFFWCFEDEKVILAPEDVVGEGKHRIYKPFVCLDYIKFRENSEEGRFDKVGYNVNGFAAISASNYDENMST